MDRTGLGALSDLHIKHLYFTMRAIPEWAMQECQPPAHISGEALVVPKDNGDFAHYTISLRM